MQNRITEKVLVMAHRGGRGRWPENTMIAFQDAVSIGADVLELDIHATSDGELVVIHDDRLERLTNGSGPVSAHTLAEIRTLDAGYSWTADAGKSYPFRGCGVTIPTLREILEAFPNARMNIDIKQTAPPIVEPFYSMLKEYNAFSRTVVGSFHDSALNQFRRVCPQVKTSAGVAETRSFYFLSKLGLARRFRSPAVAFQPPETSGRLRIITPEFIRAAHRLSMQVHVWTVNEASDMRRLINWGADGIITDYPQRLIDLLDESNHA